MIASEICKLGIGIDLIQPRTKGIGKTNARGVEIKGTDEAFKLELKEALSMLFGEKGQLMKKRCLEIKDMVQRDMQSGGAHQAMMKLGHLVDQNI